MKLMSDILPHSGILSDIGSCAFCVFVERSKGRYVDSDDSTTVTIDVGQFFFVQIQRTRQLLEMKCRKNDDHNRRKVQIFRARLRRTFGEIYQRFPGDSSTHQRPRIIRGNTLYVIKRKRTHREEKCWPVYCVRMIRIDNGTDCSAFEPYRAQNLKHAIQLTGVVIRSGEGEGAVRRNMLFNRWNRIIAVTRVNKNTEEHTRRKYIYITPFTYQTDCRQSVYTCISDYITIHGRCYVCVCACRSK